MTFSAHFLVVFLSISIVSWGLQSCHGRSLSFEMHHRFSDPVKKWVERSGTGIRVDDWPEKGSVDYYRALAAHDRILHGRRLSENAGMLTFSEGNTTVRISSLGFLHYTSIKLGTPGMDFLVALDTGSDLFWVPCDCSQCPTSADGSGMHFEFSIYSPSTSSTSKNVPCNSNLCESQSECSGSASHCPYKVAYVSADTSSSGILVEDVLHLETDDSHPEDVSVPIIFGCGRVQTGSFLDVAAPNGLFGLGMEKISVPSILSSNGLTVDSFSMCFGRDGIGRISFGDKGSSDQEETPFNLRQSRPTYNISVVEIRVGTTLVDTNFSALFDTGTSFTYLRDPAYTRLSESFNSQAQNNRHPSDPKIPFEYCYYMSSTENISRIPSVSLTMEGGGQFSVLDPIIVIFTRVEYVYCLAVVKSQDLNIIGQNFMTGQRVVFDREKHVLGWKNFNCYSTEDFASLPINTRNSTAVPPAVSAEPTHYTPEATREIRNDTPISVLPPSPPSHSPHTNSYFGHSFILLFLLFSAIL